MAGTSLNKTFAITFRFPESQPHTRNRAIVGKTQPAEPEKSASHGFQE